MNTHPQIWPFVPHDQQHAVIMNMIRQKQPDWHKISCYPNLTWNIVQRYPYQKWNWYDLYNNYNVMKNLPMDKIKSPKDLEKFIKNPGKNIF